MRLSETFISSFEKSCISGKVHLNRRASRDEQYFPEGKFKLLFVGDIRIFLLLSFFLFPSLNILQEL